MNPPPFRLLDTGLLPAADNMALDQIILEEVASGHSPPTVRFLRFDPPAALVGRHQDVQRELRESYCRQHGVDVNRRITGGGAIYFQPSALGWEVFGRPGDPPFDGPLDRLLTRICQAAAGALTRFGLNARFRPRNDIEVDGRKIGGTGGAFLTDGFMFQGTLLRVNEIEAFLKSLRVPVEKLKKREIETLMERMCFLGDCLADPPSLPELKEVLAEALAGEFGATLRPGPLTDREKAAWGDRRGYFQSDQWVHGRRPAKSAAPALWAARQTPNGGLRAHLWVEPSGRRIRQALVTGDFFCRPQRFVMDLEAWLKGVKATPEALAAAVEAFYAQNDGELVGIEPRETAQAFIDAADRLNLVDRGYEPAEANELFLVNVQSSDLHALKPAWLLLPYCAKKVDCDFRRVPDCGRCGECEFDHLYQLAEAHNLMVYSVQSFEHLMEVLRDIESQVGHDDRACYVGSCCEAFYAKHQLEMEAVSARGLLVNLDATTCYDLGKGMEAYFGRFDNQTFMNRRLIAKVIEQIGRG